MRFDKRNDYASLWRLDNITLYIDKRFVMAGSFIVRSNELHVHQFLFSSEKEPFWAINMATSSIPSRFSFFQSSAF
ncbi:hypothetical protein BM451_16455 [Dickeya dadantii]|nr:hypothetical protein BM451_16455 [Dickeya dadantii]